MRMSQFMNIKFLVAIFSVLIIQGCGESQELSDIQKNEPVVDVKKNDDSTRYRELVNLYVGKTVPYNQFGKIGTPETLSGTTNQQWVAYFPKANFTIITNKKTDIVRAIYIGKREF